jgi:hypothetical protein
LQLCLIQHSDSSACMLEHFTSRAKGRSVLPRMTEGAKEALEPLTKFYELYRTNTVATDKASVIHRSLPIPSMGGPTSKPEMTAQSLLTYDACSGCGDATSVHSVLDQQTVDAGFVKQLLQNSNPSVWIEVSVKDSHVPVGESLEGVGSIPDRGSVSTGDDEQSEKELRAVAAKVEVGHDDVSYYYKLRGRRDVLRSSRTSYHRFSVIIASGHTITKS